MANSADDDDAEAYLQHALMKETHPIWSAANPLRSTTTTICSPFGSQRSNVGFEIDRQNSSATWMMRQRRSGYEAWRLQNTGLPLFLKT